MVQQAHGELERTTTNKHAIVAHGQLCAVLAAATGAGASMLAASGVNAPTAQSAFVYAILALIYADDASDTAPGPLVWLAIAIFDVEGNYLVVKAFQHTSMTSVMPVTSSWQHRWATDPIIRYRWLIG